MKDFPIELILRYLSNQATDLEQDQLLDWVSQDATHQRLFHELKETWERQHPQEESFNAHAALARINERINANEVITERKTFPWLKVAASLLFLIAASLTLWLMSNQPDEKLNSFTTLDHIDTLLLADGSEVILNKHSTLEYPETFSSTLREVKLTGEAFFDIKHDASRPFVVVSDELRTQVLGTSFNIKTDSLSSTVIVKSGRVKVSNEYAAEILSPSDQLTFRKSDHSFTKSLANVDEAMSWIDNSFYFDDTPLETAIKSVAERFHLSLEVNAGMNGCVITGKFPRAQLEDVLAAISYSSGIKYQISNDKLIITGTSCH